jgi:hypothetical protein
MAAPMIEDKEVIREERVYSTPLEKEPLRLANGSPVVLPQRDFILPLGPRVRWESIVGGCVVALGVLMLLVNLGWAIGFSTIDQAWRMNTNTAKDLLTGAGVWMALALLTAYFIAGLVSAKVTDRPDRGGALLHGMMTWVLLSLFLSWLIGSAINKDVADISAGLSRGIAPPGESPPSSQLTNAELAHNLGLDDPTQVSIRLADPRLSLVLAALTGMSVGEVQTAVNNLQTRVAELQNDPTGIEAEVQNFLSWIGERARRNAPQSTTTMPNGVEIGSWTLFGIMVVTLLVSIMGAFAGVPNRHQWQSALIRV